MAVDAQTFRAVLGQWPTGVAVVTTTAGGRWHGMTASSFSSVSLDPPLVLVCLARHIYTHELVERSGVFAVSFLGKDQAPIGHRFAGREPGDRFAEHPWTAAPTGAPVLDAALAWLDCRVAHAYPGGDHTIFVGEVLTARIPRRTAPLLFHSRAWGQLADPLPDEVTIADTGLAAALHRRLRAGGTAPARVTQAGVARLLEAVRAAGVRIRTPLPAPPGNGTRPAVSVLVEDATRLAAVPREAPVVAEVVHGPDAPDLVAAARERGLPVVGRVPDAFSPERQTAVLAAVDRLVEAGCAEIALDEGPDAASPLRVRNLLQDAVARTRPVPLRVRLREAHGLGLVNALTAMKSGVRHFDVTLGGVDGGLCAEDVLFLAARLDVATPIDRAALVTAATDLEAIWGSALPGRTYRIAS
ncbi:NADH-FMN oxidoreductase RutF, flavin reductase (DIM6/NTAB) family [Thermomonospora echinospora]|uniref:NADH-FMN oxidoreductase RutF, flavin reductase (DIM6/NTAB) family n=1 Tax=Thermomonospora echinospora TaxID=1992 RepID=A0A1H6B1S7_9ACTN|nr:flavin reductase [Thermomonospora echinospora]SEG54759.1 NADH-FMN oxidoreductase RutF, flavin reductase (DIM6/NTAB) family [Thermomonospora echinospora]